MTVARHSEFESYVRFISGSLITLVACLEGLSEEDADWTPPAASANSLRVLAVHSLANAEENVLGIVCGLPIGRSRDEEFLTTLPIREIQSQLHDLTERMIGSARTSAIELNDTRSHPRRGELFVRDVLIVAARHAAEHMGQAELTKDLLVTARSS